MYGIINRAEPDTLFSPRGVRVVTDNAVGLEHLHFECFECQAKKRRRRVYLYGGLAALVALAIVAREVVVG
jgi:hypothetical protein